MKNQYAKYKNPDGSKKNDPAEVGKIQNRYFGKYGISFFSSEKENVKLSRNPIKRKRRQQRISRVQNRG